ncbi:MAG: hypothetical protein HY658_13670 [Actinobacteria bacterium]|nr:hypothetical protein [Actinomycetota bacterium]
MVRAFEGFPSIRVLRIVGREDLWVTEAALQYPGLEGGPWQVVEVQEVRDGRLARVRAVFGAPFEPADWRAPYVERT